MDLGERLLSKGIGWEGGLFPAKHDMLTNAGCLMGDLKVNGGSC